MLVDRKAYTKTLCMSELRVQRTRLAQTHYFDAKSGSGYASFVYARQGTAAVNTMGRTMEFTEGSLFYIPEGQRFSAVWSGSPGIEFFSLHIINRKLDLQKTDRYVIQRIDAMSTPETGTRIRAIYDLFATEKRDDRVRAVGLYYGFYADVLPHLQAEPPMKRNPVLTEAMAYIENNYAQNFDIRHLAAAVCISESRLHHLFREELGTTPGRFHNQLRIERATAALRSTNRTVADIAAANGFHSATYFRETFKAMTGMTPSEYRALVRAGEQEGEA